MCTGAEIALIASAAASAGGTMIQQNEAQSNAKRQAAARNNELDLMRRKNSTLSDQASLKLGELLKQKSAESQAASQADTTAQQVGDAVGAASEVPTAEIPLAGSAPDVVKNEMADRIAGAISKSKASAANLGKLSAYNTQMFNNQMSNRNTADQVQPMVSQAQRNAQMLPYYQDLAQLSATKRSSGIGQLLSAAGTVGGLAAGSGMFSGASGLGMGQKVGSMFSSSPVGPYQNFGVL